jgi:hypothetical protein
MVMTVYVITIVLVLRQCNGHSFSCWAGDEALKCHSCAVGVCQGDCGWLMRVSGGCH